MRNRRGRLLLVIAVLLILAGLGYAGYICGGYIKGQREYEELLNDFTSYDDEADTDTKGSAATGENIGETDDDKVTDEQLKYGKEEELPADAPERRTIDWAGLKVKNEDIVAWIDIPAIEISYPVLQAEDNDFYLHRDINREYLFAGSIFMDCLNSADLSNYNTIIYGHNMRDGSMFAGLKRFHDEATLKSCNYFWIYTPEGDFLYKISSIHYAAVGSDTYTVRFGSYQEYVDWLNKMQNATELRTGVELQNGDKVVTLSTCTTDASIRTVVHGKCIWYQQGIT